MLALFLKLQKIPRPKPLKNCRFSSAHCMSFDASPLENPREYRHKPYRQKLDSLMNIFCYWHCGSVFIRLELNSTTRRGHRLRTPPTNTTNGQKFATSQHLDMSRCWALSLRRGKICCRIVVSLSVGGVRIVGVRSQCPFSGVWLLKCNAKMYYIRVKLNKVDKLHAWQGKPTWPLRQRRPWSG